MAKGSNHTFPKPKQSVHVTQKKDKMAGNVGGSAHMSAGDKPKITRNIKFSGAKGKK
jgi:hypothetical protein